MTEQKKGFTFSKTTTIVGILITILGLLVPVVFAYGKLNERVSSIENDHEMVEDSVSELNRDISDSKTERAVMIEKLSTIEENVKEIKQDIKDLKSK